jgi:hypothetical protein
MDKSYRFVTRVDECESQLTRLLFELWDDLREGLPSPIVSSFDYLHRPRLLSNLIISQVLRDPVDFKLKYFGNDLTKIFETLDTKSTIREVVDRNRGNPASEAFVVNSMEIMTRCTQECRPVINGPRQLDWAEKNFVRYESLSGPFVDAQNTVVQLATVMDLHSL